VRERTERPFCAFVSSQCNWEIFTSHAMLKKHAFEVRSFDSAPFFEQSTRGTRLAPAVATQHTSLRDLESPDRLVDVAVLAPA
jgi:hypothetical protein